MDEHTRRTEAVLRIAVQRAPGVLARIAALFDRRGVEMWRLEVAPVPASDRAEISVRTRGASAELERLRRAIENLVDVLSADLRRADDG
jgi:acetolactate synthase small subunit